MKQINFFKYSALSIVWLWLIIFSCIPFSLVLFVSFIQYDAHLLLHFTATLANYLALYDVMYWHVLTRSLYLATVTTLCCLILAYPFAYFLAQLPRSIKSYGVMLVIIPFWTSSLVRSYALIAILKAKGVLNTTLLALGLIHTPLPILYTNCAVLIGLVYNLLPFMILPILTNIERLDYHLIDAARDLGALKLTIFIKIILPLTLPGIISGCTLVFLPAMTIFFIPDILGGAKSTLVGNLIQRQFLVLHNWQAGAATSVVLTIIIALLIACYQRLLLGKGKTLL
jgi:spermidine/putrescine transport system permease protein